MDVTAVAGGQQHYCWSVAVSSLDNVISPLVDTMDLHHCATLVELSATLSNQIPVFWLGKLCFTTLSHGVNNLCSAMRQWSLNVVVHMLFTAMLMINPRLTQAQQFQLMSVITRAMEQLFLRHSLDQRLVRGILALACPDRGSRVLLTYLIEIIRSLSFGGGGESESSEDVECGGGEVMEEDGKVARILHQEYSLEKVYVAAMPAGVRRAVVAALRREEEGPRCCITLEPVVQQGSGKVSPDVVAVVQSSPRTGEEHAFLYRGTALYKWLGKPQVPVAPETRSVVRPMDVYRLS